MGRMHAPGKGISRSSLPFVRTAPSVSTLLLPPFLPSFLLSFFFFFFVLQAITTTVALSLLFLSSLTFLFPSSPFLLSPFCSPPTYLVVQWLSGLYSAEDVKNFILALARKGHRPSQIGA